MDTVQELTAARLIERAVALEPLLREHALETEREHWIATPVLQTLEEEGFFRLGAPVEFGGISLSLRDQIELLRALARGCGSTSWVMGVYLGSTGVLPRFSREAQAEVYADGSSRISGSVTPTGRFEVTEGGYLLSGRWGFQTGSPGAAWCLPAGRIEVDGRTEVYMALVPAADLTSLYDWDTSGMAGTGSNTLECHDVFVPEHRVLPASKAGGAEQAGSLGVVLGLAEAAVSDFVAGADGRAIAFTNYSDKRLAPITHLRAGEAQVKIDLANALTDGIVNLVDSGASLTAADKTRIVVHRSTVFNLAREAVRLIRGESGASSSAVTAPIQRIARDIESVSLHALYVESTNLERYGRFMVGLDPVPGHPLGVSH